MISVKEAYEIVLSQAHLSAVEAVVLKEAHGRVLRETVICDRDQPAFNRSTMDGIALSSEAFKRGIRSFMIYSTITAGMPAPKSGRGDGCFKIMTGAVVPDGCDTVIPIEYVEVKNGLAEISGLISAPSGWNIRRKGEERLKGSVLLKSGCRMISPHIACAASVGKAVIRVSRLPSVAIIATGDELVDAGRKRIKPYQVRSSNVHAVSSAIEARQLGATRIFHFKDEPETIERGLTGILKRFDIVVLSGGVSMGDFDFIPQVLTNLRVRRLFHKVAQKPGKPFWFGKTASHKIVFALPGNPVSTLVCAFRYLIPFLEHRAGLTANIHRGILKKKFQKRTALTAFVPVRSLSAQDGRRMLEVVENRGSGDFASLAHSDGFIEVKASCRHLPALSVVDYYSWS